jgi:hypothetical protein
MAKPAPINKTVPLESEFFCDGAFYLLTSHSLGGSGIDPHALADILGSPGERQMNDLLRKGICLPLAFEGDCAMDGETLFVVGDLDARHEQAWIARLTGKLSIPCGKFLMLCGGGDGDGLARAISGKPADEDYFIYQTIEVPPGDYRVDVLAYLDSDTVMFMDDDSDEDAIRKKYAHLPKVDERYVVRLTPLDGDLPLPPLVDEVNWPGVFAFR